MLTPFTLSALQQHLSQPSPQIIYISQAPISANQPFFDLQTIEGVWAFQRSYGLSPANGVANLPTRLKLRQLAQFNLFP